MSKIENPHYFNMQSLSPRLYEHNPLSPPCMVTPAKLAIIFFMDAHANDDPTYDVNDKES